MFGFWESILSFLIRTVGLRTDAADAAGSLHAKVAEAKSNINTHTDTKIGTSADTRASNTVMGWLSTPIKSVQRGVTQCSTTASDTTVTISDVITAKAMVIISASGTPGADTDTAYEIARKSLVRANLSSSTALVLTRANFAVDGMYVAWQVVEFY